MMPRRDHRRSSIAGPILRRTARHELTMAPLIPIGAVAFGVLGPIAGMLSLAVRAIRAEELIVFAIGRGLVLTAQAGKRFVPQEGRGVAVAKVLRFVVGIFDALGVIVASMPVGACRCGGIGSFLEGTCSNHCRDLSPPRTTK